MNWMVYLDCLLGRISDLELLTQVQGIRRPVFV